jgi:SAM-dependent methyltransferase
MNDAEFQLYEGFEDDQWWFVGKRRLIRALLADPPPHGRLLDLGCGMGGLLREFGSEVACFGSDRSAYALRVCRDKGAAALARADLGAQPFRSESFDVVLALDVIEHLDDDVGFLRRAASLLAPGARFVIAAPAFQMLWSQHDETFQHRRRYNVRQLDAVVRAAGLVPERSTYLHTAIFPVAFVWRVASRKLGLGRRAPKHDFWPIPRLLDRLLGEVYRLEARLLRRVDLPFGVSVACIARRAGDGERAR